MGRDLYEVVLRRIYPSYRFTWQMYSERLNTLAGSGKKWLDAGCGKNAMIREFPARYSVGTDRLVHPKLENLPFGDGTFDLVTAHFVIEHVEFPECVFREFSRIMAPGGHLLIRTMNLLNYTIFIASLIPERPKDKIVRSIWGRQEDSFRTWYRANTPRAISRVARRSGLEGEELVMNENLNVIHPLAFAVSLAIERVLSIRPLGYLKNTIVAVYRKPCPEKTQQDSPPAIINT